MTADIIVEWHRDLSQSSEHESLTPDIDTVWNMKILNLQVGMAWYHRSWEVSAESVAFLCHFSQMFMGPEFCKQTFPVVNVCEELWIQSDAY